MKSRRHIRLLYLVMLILLFMPNGEVEGLRIIYEWSRKVFDFVSNSAFARRFLSGMEPVTTVCFGLLNNYCKKTSFPSINIDLDFFPNLSSKN